MTMHPTNYRATPAASERGLESHSAAAGRVSAAIRRSEHSRFRDGCGHPEPLPPHTLATDESGHDARLRLLRLGHSSTLPPTPGTLAPTRSRSESPAGGGPASADISSVAQLLIPVGRTALGG